MEKRTFGRTKLQVSVLGFGGAPIGYLNSEQASVEEILNTLLDQGVNLIDTAAGYPGSESAIAQAVGHRRDQFVVVTKCGSALSDVPGEPWSEELILATVDRSLTNLRTDHLDVMLLHTCDLATLQRGEAIGALVKAQKAGKIRFAGYSGDNEAAAYAVGRPEIAVLETSVNIVDQANIDSVLPLAVEHGVGVLVKRPIANACWKAPSEQAGLYRHYAQHYHDRLKAMNITPGELGFAGEPNDVWPDIALRFTLAQKGVHSAIIGTTKLESVRKNLVIAKRAPLPAEAVQLLRNAFAKANSSGEWTGQT